MRPRHPLPHLWLMTDERMGDSLWDALARLPRGSGVVFRHYGLDPAERRALFVRIAKVARRRGLLVVRAGAQRLGRCETGVHGQKGQGLRTWPAHSRREAIAGVRAGADLLFVSPVFATRSHPGARVLGSARLGLLIRGLPVPVIALGGMNAQRAASLQAIGIYGWAAIDAWVRDRAHHPANAELSKARLSGEQKNGASTSSARTETRCLADPLRSGLRRSTSEGRTD